MKDMIESKQHVGPPIALTGFPPQVQQPYQHVGQGHLVFPGSVQHQMDIRNANIFEGIKGVKIRLKESVPTNSVIYIMLI